jgi:hypothetical protein
MTINLLQLNFDFDTNERKNKWRIKKRPRDAKVYVVSTKLIDITKQLDKFLSSSASSVLLKETNGISGLSIIEAQVQKRRLDSDRSGTTGSGNTSATDFNCLNIVNVVVAEKNRRKGLFTDFLELLEGFGYSSYIDKCSLFYVRIDKVMNPILDEFLSKKGYTRTISGNETHYSYHKTVHNINDVGTDSAQRPAAELEFAACPVSWTEDRNYADSLSSNSSAA